MADKVRNLLSGDDAEVQRSEEDTVIGPGQSDVPRAMTCQDHPRLMEDIGEIKALLKQHEKRGDEIQTTLKEIFGRLREMNGQTADQKKDVAVLTQEVRDTTVNEATRRGFWNSVVITTIGLFLREGVKRVFGF